MIVLADGARVEAPRLFKAEPWRLRMIVPGRPVPWQRAGSFGKRRFTPKKMLDHQRRVKDIAFQIWRGRAPWPGPIGARLYFSFPLNKDGSETAALIGDGDNLNKLILDALSKLVYLDDRQVFPIEVFRVRGTRTGASYVELRELTPEEAIVAAPEWAHVASAAANLPAPTGVPF